MMKYAIVDRLLSLSNVVACPLASRVTGNVAKQPAIDAAIISIIESETAGWYLSENPNAISHSAPTAQTIHKLVELKPKIQ